MFFKITTLLIIYLMRCDANNKFSKNYAIKKGCAGFNCNYLYHDIGKSLNYSVDPCEDFYSFTCSGAQKTVTKNIDENLMNVIKKFFKNNKNDGFYKSVSIEKTLYKSCMGFGKDKSNENEEDNNEVQKKRILLGELTSLLLNNLHWQEIDKELFQKGLGHAFFQINVIRDPNQKNTNIISIEPPSLTSLSDVLEMLKVVYARDIVSNKTLINRNDYIFMYQFMTEKEIQSLMYFLYSVLEAASNPVAEIVNSQNKRTTIFEWNSHFNRRDQHNKVTDVNWNKIIVGTFAKANVNIDSSEPIIVKNVPYFSTLFNILLKTPNNIIAKGIVTKTLTENLRYIDWEAAESLKQIERSSFCLHETKLYGTSYLLIKKKRESFNIHFDKTLHKIVENIKKNMRLEIYNSKSISYKEESHLLAELDAVTAHVRYAGLPPHIDNYYESYHLTNDYFTDIINYRTMLKHKELRMLKQESGSQYSRYLPFSVVDLAHAANRFAINVYFSNHIQSDAPLPKQIYYGRYGVNIAHTLYALMIENKSIDVVYRRRSTLRKHLVYSLDYTKCSIFNENNENVDIDVILDMYSVQSAYKAMTQFDLSPEEIPLKFDVFPVDNVNNLNQFFFLEYAKEHCSLGKKAINSIVNKSNIFIENLWKCRTNNVNCNWSLFEISDKNMYLIKL